MPGGLLPLFPLNVVVFPRTRLPLHIFEERYKEMVGVALRDNSEFGIAQVRDEGILNAGCTVVVEKVLTLYKDGRLDILTGGRRRFEVLVLNQEKAYLRGEVEYFDDEDDSPVPPELRQKALAQYHELAGLGALAPGAEADLDDPQLSFQLAQSVPDLDLRGLLLRNRSEAERLRELNDYFSKYLPRQREVLRIRSLAPRNGFGGKPDGL
jgi:Lon protease-like protein